MLCWLDIYVEFVSKKKVILLSLKHFSQKKKKLSTIYFSSKILATWFFSRCKLEIYFRIEPDHNHHSLTTICYYIFCFLLMFFSFFSVFFFEFLNFFKNSKKYFLSLVYLLGYDATLSSACCTLALASILLLVTAYLSAMSWPARSRAAE